MAPRLLGSYAWDYETPSNGRPIGAAAAPSVYLWQRGKAVTTIARTVGARRRSIWRWVQTYQQQGFARAAHSGASVLSLCQREDPLGPSATTRGTGRGFVATFHLVDVPLCCSPDREMVAPLCPVAQSDREAVALAAPRRL